MDAPSIEIRELSLSHGRKRVLHDVDLKLEAGESLGLIGPNGAGKTSLVLCVLGLLRPQRGAVRIGGRSPEDPELRRILGYVPERASVDRRASGLRQLRQHHALAGRPRSSREQEVSELLRRVGLGSAARAPARTYSKGMLQRLAFAIALVGRPRLVILDEPFSGVDPAGVAALRSLVAEVRAAGATILLNSHRLDQITRICDRVALLARGRLQGVHECREGDRALESLVVEAAGGEAA